MIKQNSNYFIDINSVFDENWYENVVRAALFAFETLKVAEKDKDSIALQIIDYNINKRLKDLVLNASLNLLPKTIDWRKKEILKIFNEFKDIIDICMACSAFESYKVKVLLPKNINFIELFNIWQSSVNEFYSQINLFITKTVDPNSIYLKIIKNSN